MKIYIAIIMSGVLAAGWGCNNSKSKPDAGDAAVDTNLYETRGDSTQETQAITSPLANPKGPISDQAETPIKYTPAVPSTTLPVNLKTIGNLDGVLKVLNTELNQAQQDKLSKSAILPLAILNNDRFSNAYLDLSYSLGQLDSMPLLITSDSMLHLYHLFFDQLLKNIEVNSFINELGLISQALVRGSALQQERYDGNLKEAAFRNKCYFAVAAAILGPKFQVPTDCRDLVTKTMALIETHKGFAGNPIFNPDCPKACDPCSGGAQPDCVTLCACEDFSQYVPRGHYTQSDSLKRYFKAMMFLSRIPMRIANDTETLQAMLYTRLMETTRLPDSRPIYESWMKIYKITSFFVGDADDLTFFEYSKAARGLFGKDFPLTMLEDPQKLAALQAELRKLRAPKILSGLMSMYLDVTATTQELRFMGQRFTVDSYVLSKMVMPYVKPDLSSATYKSVVDGCAQGKQCDRLDLDDTGCICGSMAGGAWGVCRLLPRGLDVASVVLGAEEADNVLTPDFRYCNIQEQMQSLKQEMSAYPAADWTSNAYFGWLFALKPLTNIFGKGWPAFMQTRTWRLKELNTVLASWTQLRHDTILYVKQSYTMSGNGMPPTYAGYVEPVPEFFHRLAFLTVFTKDGLAKLDALPPEIGPVMDQMKATLDKLTMLSVKELENRELDQTDQNFIRDMPTWYDGIVSKMAAIFTEPVDDPSQPHEDNPAGDGLKTTIIADVHTDANTGSVLEEAVGPVHALLILHETPQGGIVAAVGPIFTYFEFPHPMSDRLTDEAWRTMLDDSTAPAQPDWFKGLY